MAVGPDGRNLVVAVPNQRNSVSLGNPNKRGDVLVFNLDSLDLKTGKIAAPVKAQLPSDSSGKAPQTITATDDPTHFLVADVADYNKGLATLVLTRDKDGTTTAAKMTAIPMFQPGGSVRRDRLDIQRAQSAVLVTYKGDEYAIVADDNYNFLDPYWKAMFEAPMFMQLTPFGPPTPIGGSASAIKVSVGGKLGIVKDPFGSNPQFMGATLPLDGYGIVNLSLSPDNTVLIGQLKGGFSANIFDGHLKDNQNHAWNVGLLIQAAIDWPEQDRLSKHIKLDPSAELLLPSSNTNANGYLGAPAGTFFDAPTIQVNVKANIGDVTGVDLPRQIATQLLLGEKAISAEDAAKPWDKLASQTQNLIAQRASNIKVTVDHESLLRLTGAKDPTSEQPGMSLLTDGKDATSNPIILSRKNADGTGGGATFGEAGAGVLFLTPDLSNPDMVKLRTGISLSPKSAHLSFTYVDNASSGTSADANLGKGTLDVSAEEPNAAARVFMGDRPLDNPGYSAITFSAGSMRKDVTTLDTLDTLKLEHRLKYLGYGITSIAGNTEEIKADGKLSASEVISVRMFEEIVESRSGYLERTLIGNNGKPTSTTIAPYKIVLSNDNIKWLNAYNAPHWMQYSGELSKKLTGWEGKTGGGVKSMGTSWVYDLMLAAQETNATQGRGKTADTKLWFAGAGSLGVQLNLGINTNYISEDNQKRVNGKDKVLGVVPTKSAGLPNAPAFDAKQWSLSNASALALKLKNPTVDTPYVGKTANASGENQQDQALLDFLSVFATTQAKGADVTKPNGYWDDIAIKNANADEIRKALFGDGTTTGGMLNSNDVLIGGTASPLGELLTTESLKNYMRASASPASVRNVDYAQWLSPLRAAMSEFDLNTPQRIAAFFAQINQESGGMSSLREGFNYTQAGLAATFSKLRAVVPGGTNTYAQLYGRPNGTKPGTGFDVPLATQELIANVAYGGWLGNTQPGDGWLFRGHGLKQVTGRDNTQAFANYVDVPANRIAGQPTGAQIMADPDLLASNPELAARSAGWFWRYRASTAGKNLNILADNLDMSKSRAEELQFNAISRGVGQAAPVERWEKYKVNVDLSLVGGNPYESVRGVLNKLGFQSQAKASFEKQFGIDLKLRTPVAISSGERNLTAVEDIDQGKLTAPFSTNVRLINQAIAEISLTNGDQNMFAFDIVPLDSNSNMVMVAKTNQSKGKNTSREVGVCGQFFSIKNEDMSSAGKKQFNAQHSIDPYTNAVVYFSSYEKKEISIWEGNAGPLDVTSTKVLQLPEHGELQERKWSQGNPIFNPSNFEYRPSVGFLGADSVVIEVMVNGWKVKLKYYLEVTDTPEPSSDKQCGERGVYWKISQSNIDPATQDLTAWQRASQLSALLATASQSLTGFQDLEGAAVGNTVGDGADAQITLDSTAAGHGWYIDPTPLNNLDDYLPTSNPNIWQAKAGTDAAGKMDMLSVLLHEYGHALGLEHSADADDFMATTLQPGERHLPRADKVALMSRHLTETTSDSQNLVLWASPRAA